jgi:hypothetical protein
MVDASMQFLGAFSPVVMILAVISSADLLVNFLIGLFKKLPKFEEGNSRRTPR